MEWRRRIWIGDFILIANRRQVTVEILKQKALEFVTDIIQEQAVVLQCFGVKFLLMKL